MQFLQGSRNMTPTQTLRTTKICLFDAWKDQNIFSQMVVWWWFTMEESVKHHQQNKPKLFYMCLTDIWLLICDPTPLMKKLLSINVDRILEKQGSSPQQGSPYRPNFMHDYKGKSSKSHYICSVWSPAKNHRFRRVFFQSCLVNMCLELPKKPPEEKGFYEA